MTNKFDELRTLVGQYGTARAERAAVAFNNNIAPSQRARETEEKEVALLNATNRLEAHIVKMGEELSLYNKSGKGLIMTALETSQEEGFRRTTTYDQQRFGDHDVFMGDITVFSQNLLSLVWSQK